MSDTGKIVSKALEQHTALPAFNIPYLPMMEPVTRALIDSQTFGLIQVARLEWEKFESQSLEAVREEYERRKDERFMRLHLDHVPVIDEDGISVDYLPILRRALTAGFQSVMVDGSRLPLGENADATRTVVKLAHSFSVPVEAELGSVLGHEEGPLPPYEELFRTGQGFTTAEEAAEFVRLTGVDWLSVSIGNIHGAIQGAAKNEKKLEARLHLSRLSEIAEATRIPLVLHGGSGIKADNVLEGIRRGIAKINIGTAIRVPYEKNREKSAHAARDAVYNATMEEIDKLQLRGSAAALRPMGAS